MFPDEGAHRRFFTMVMAYLHLPSGQVLYINKKRVGADVTQENKLCYRSDHHLRAENGSESDSRERSEALPEGASVLIADDFTNSGR